MLPNVIKTPGSTNSNSWVTSYNSCTFVLLFSLLKTGRSVFFLLRIHGTPPAWSSISPPGHPGLRWNTSPGRKGSPRCKAASPVADDALPSPQKWWFEFKQQTYPWKWWSELQKCQRRCGWNPVDIEFQLLNITRISKARILSHKLRMSPNNMGQTTQQPGHLNSDPARVKRVSCSEVIVSSRLMSRPLCVCRFQRRFSETKPSNSI